MKTLHLSLKAKWYEMIENGEKKEEYREIKPYWEKRMWFDSCRKRFIDYTHVKFSYGYTGRTMTFEIENITIGIGNPKWGAPCSQVFIIKLGNRI